MIIIYIYIDIPFDLKSHKNSTVICSTHVRILYDVPNTTFSENIALNKPCELSSNYWHDAYAAYLAVDNDMSTIMAINYEQHPWMAIDLRSTYTYTQKSSYCSIVITVRTNDSLNHYHKGIFSIYGIQNTIPGTPISTSVMKHNFKQIKMMFLAFYYWSSREHILDVGVTNLKLQLRCESLNVIQCWSVASFDQMIPYTLHCPTTGATGRFVVFQSNSKIGHLLLLFDVIIYGRNSRRFQYKSVTNQRARKIQRILRCDVY